MLRLSTFLIGSVALAGDFSLLEAIRDGSLQAVKTRIAGDVDVNEPLRNGSTPLAWAAYEGNEALADLLLTAKAKVATVDEYGETPLSLASATAIHEWWQSY